MGSYSLLFTSPIMDYHVSLKKKKKNVVKTVILIVFFFIVYLIFMISHTFVTYNSVTPTDLICLKMDLRKQKYKPIKTRPISRYDP